MSKNAPRLGFVAKAALIALGCFVGSHAAYGQTTLNWTVVREGHPNLNGVASDGSLYAMVADYGEIYTSTDGIAWNKQVADAARRSIRAVTWAKGQFVAVGDGVVLTSPDGQAWTARDMTLPGTRGALQAVTGSANRYVAVGDGGQVAWSADGVSWTAGSSGTTASLMDVAFGGGVFVAVGEPRTVLTSPDGSSWSPAATIPSGDPWAHIRDLAHTGTTFVAIGGEPSTYTPLVMTSTDGQAWTRQSISAGWKLLGVVAGNEMVMTFGDGWVYTSSDDGVTWTGEPLLGGGPGAPKGLSAGAYGPAGFVACGGRQGARLMITGGALYTAPVSGSPWTARTLEASRHNSAVAEGNGVLCAQGLARSTDGGLTWTNQALPELNVAGGGQLVYGNGVFVGAPCGNTMQSPTCNGDWQGGKGIYEAITPDGFDGFCLNDVAFGDGQFVVVGDAGNDSTSTYGSIIFSSTDGVNWTRRDRDLGLTGPPFGIRSVAYGNGRWVAPWPRRALITSEDGITWTLRDWPFDDDDASVRFVNDRFFHGSGSPGWTSADGLTWTPMTWPGGRGGPPIAYGAGRYMADGSDGTLHVSTDLVHWTANSTGTGHNLESAVYLEDLNRFVAVGDSAIVYSSGSPAVSVGDASVTEGNAGETDMTFTVTLYDGNGAPVTVDYATADASATAGIDYTAASGELTLDGTPMSSQPVVVKVKGDTVPEADETLRLSLLSATGAAIGPGPGTGTILTDDGTLSISDGTPRNVQEGNAGQTAVEFTVTLANATGSDPVTVQYASASSSFAVTGLDFEAVGGTLTLVPPGASQTITANVFGDTLGENNESFVVRLSNPVNAWIARDTGNATIINDDPPPTVAIDDVTVTEGNDGTRTAYFSVYLSSYFNQPITIDYATSNGTATSGSDYLATAGSITINPGLQSSVPIAISVIGDAVPEGTETFTVTISNARYDTESISITKDVGTGTILDDEGVVLPSTAATWTLVQEGMPQLYGVAGDGSQYVVVGSYGEIWTSTDGVAWTQRANPDRDPASGAARALRGVTHGDGLWVAVGQWDNLTSDAGRRYPIVLTSTNGATWTLRDVSAATQSTNRNLLGVAYGTGLYVAVGSGGCGPSNARTTCILTSPDGVSWTYRPSPASVSLNAVAFGEPSGGGRFVAVGPNRTVLTSSDGTTWTPGDVPSTMPLNLNAVAWNGTQFVVVGGTGGLSPGIMTSPDGLTWTRQAVPPEMLYAFNGVGSGGGVTVAVSGANPADLDGTSIVTSSSSDGVTWTRRALKSVPPGVSPWLTTVGFGPKGFVTGGLPALYTSPNGTTQWTSGTLASSWVHQGIAFGNGVFCSVGTNGAIRRSTDGVVWTQASSPPDPPAYFGWNPVVYAVGRFWTAGVSLSIASSADCDTWGVRRPATPVLATDPVTGWLHDLAYGRLGSSDILVAVGRRYATPGSPAVSSPVIFSSTDGGVTWAERSPVFPAGVQQRFLTVAYGNGRFVAFGMESATGEPFLNSSDDGVAWTAHPTDVFDKGSYDAVNDVAWGNGLFVAAGNSIRTSLDGVTWTLRKSRSDGADSFMGVVYGGERFVAVGNSGVAYLSADGIVWTPGSAPTDHQLRAVATSPATNRVVAVGDSAIAYTDLEPPVSPPAISIGDASIAEGKTASTLGFTVSLSQTSAQTVTVQYATANGTATAGSDYQAAAGTLTFLPGETQKVLGVAVLGDSVYERDETVSVNIANPTNATIGHDNGVGTLLNDDPKPALAIKDASVPEGHSGTTLSTFTVTLSPASGTAASVSWATRDGTATVAGQDYVAGSGVLVFNPGQTSKTITVRVKGDRTRESNETFFVDLTQPVDAVISSSTAKGTIRNDD